MTLVVAIGGVRSGKSAWAEHQAAELAAGAAVTVLATADPGDATMADRIGRHQTRRADHWTVVDLHGRDDPAAALPERGVALLDGLGGWVASLLSAGGAFDADPDAAKAATTAVTHRAHEAIEDLIDAADEPGRSLVVVTEETGLGVVPMGAGTAAWVDLLGELNQRLVRGAELAVVVVAGRALPLGDTAQPLRPTRSDPPLSVVPPDESIGPNTPQSAPGNPADRRAHPRLVGASPAARTRRAEAEDPAERVAPPAPAPKRQNDQSADPLPSDQLAALRQHGDRLVRPGDADHAVNVVAQGPPTWLTDALAGVLLNGDITRYPDVAVAERAVGTLYGRPDADVVVTNGAAQALWLLPNALRPRLAVCVHPLFTEAEAALHAHGVPVVRVLRDPADDFVLDPEAVPDGADLVVLGNPAAASGTLAPRDAIVALRRPGRTIVVDEAFMDLVPGEAEAMVSTPYDDVIVVRSFTKSLSVPGLRCGAALTSPALAQRLRDVRAPWSVNAFAIAALVALSKHPEELATRATRANAELADLVARLEELAEVRVWPAAANHALVQVPDGPRAVAGLRAAQIAVRPCGTFPGLTDDHLRITARDAAANAALVRALAETLAGDRDPGR